VSSISTRGSVANLKYRYFAAPFRAVAGVLSR
jgi:hypothetical protein